MTVAELIDALKGMPQSAQVVYADDDGAWGRVCSVSCYNDNLFPNRKEWADGYVELT